MAANLTRNISYLSLSQIANYAFPLVTIPYVTRVLGPSSYALTEFAGIILVYFMSLVEFGFYTTATRKVAQEQNSGEALSEIFSSVLSAKFLLMLCALAILLLLILLVPKLNANSEVLILSIPFIIGASLNPDFLFLGLQKAPIIAFCNVFLKGLATACIFIFINEPKDYLWLNFINGSATIGISLSLLFIAFRKIKGLKFLSFSWASIKVFLLESRFIFISNFSTRVYGFISIPMGGFLMSPTQLGIFAAASKLINVGQNVLFQPLHGALLPYLASKVKESKDNYLKEHRRFLVLLASAIAIISLGLIFLAPWFIPLIFGQQYFEAIPLLQLMAPMLFIGVFAHLYLQQGLLILTKDRQYMNLILIIGTLSIILNYFLIGSYQEMGAALARLITEFLLALFAALAFYKSLRKN
ncbi:MAG: oligosaccharide flippase family protein [Bacteroidetes bacterium]|nr:oligosaccharide flippase family protein [Bacteroidota bacterium]